MAATMPLHDNQLRSFPIVRIPVDAIDVSEYNVGDGPAAEEIQKMAAGLKSGNIMINAPIVYCKKDERWGLVAGRLRVEGAKHAGYSEVECRDASTLDEVQLIELSLQENVTRRHMTDLERWKAFEKLFRAGRSVAEISSQFDMTDKAVRQHLAIGQLPKPVIALADKGKVEDGALAMLTTGSTDQLKRFAKLKSPPKSKWEVECWLEGKKGRIPSNVAIFDLSTYKGETSSDLFAEKNDPDSYLLDVDQFWELQKAAIKARVKRYKDQGWEVVEVKGYWWQGDYEKAGKADGGKVYYQVRDNGEVEFHRGWKPRGRSVPASPAGASKKPAKPELSQSMQWYLRAHRHLTIQEGLHHDTDVALALVITMALSRHTPWRAERETFSFVNNQKQFASIEASPNFKQVDTAYAGMMEELGVSPDYPDQHEVFAALCQYNRDSLLYFLRVTVAALLEVAPFKLTEAVAAELDLHGVSDWKPDDAFWAGLTSRTALVGILREIAPKEDWNKSKATLAELRKSAKQLVPEGWRPRWLLFPGSFYGARPAGHSQHLLTAPARKKGGK